jgi:hypothetical protein
MYGIEGTVRGVPHNMGQDSREIQDYEVDCGLITLHQENEV